MRFGSMKPIDNTFCTAGQHALQRAVSRIAGVVDDVGLQDDVAVADVARDVDARCRRVRART